MPQKTDPLERIRSLCLAMPNVDEARHFGQPSFRVAGKMFATCSDKQGAWRLQVLLEPLHALRLIESDPRFKPYERMKHVVSMQLDGVRDWEEVRKLLQESYRLIASRPSRPKRARSTRTRPR
jgi:predicted DNA-binding protein (MmcQ/YjbR family)